MIPPEGIQVNINRKSGATRSDINQIRQLAYETHPPLSAEDIADTLRLEVGTVESFIEHFAPQYRVTEKKAPAK